MKRNGGSRKAANVNKRAFPINPTKRKLYLLLALLLCSGVASAQVVIKGNVYGGGEGSTENVEHGQVTGNTCVIVNGGTVGHSLYGGGEFGSVGTFTRTTPVVYNAGQENELTVDVPTKCEDETGLAKVIINGGKIGYFKEAKMPEPGTDTWGDSYGYVFAGCRGDADSITYPKAVALAVADSTYLEINSGAFITASVYGGCENGLLLGNSHVKIAGGQIGVGYWKDSNGAEHLDSLSFYQENYESLWTTAINAIRNSDSTAIANSTAHFHECHAWPFGNNNDEYLVYDIFAGNPNYPNDPNLVGGSLNASDGNTFFGKVFGGGSGYYPIAPGVWRRSSGRVIGNTLVEIEGGHILTAVFGGNEMTDVEGTCVVKMTGGTVGVPQLVSEIEQRPLNSHIFGSGLGDLRTYFNQWTNVDSTYVYITGGTVFGSVFGGGQDGHVLGNVCVTVKDSIVGNEVVSSPLIGTWGNTSFEGNVFGAGRGFSGEALTAGGVGGNTEVNIEGGTMLGSVYGGGRLASVGLHFVGPGDNNYGLLQDGTDHGYTTVNIIGGTIGNRFELVADSLGNTIGGNVFGGSMGRRTKLDGTTLNPIWENLGMVKQTYVNINKADDKNLVIKGHVYGGGNIGRVEQNTLVDIDKGTIGFEATTGNYIGGNVYGGGKGTPIAEKAGLVKGNAYVDMSNGWVTRSIYGGGEFGSVGTFTSYYNANSGDHFAGEPMACQSGTGLASVIVSGGLVGLSDAMMPTPGTDAVDDDFGYIFAGGRGTNDLAYEKANILAVVDSTYLEISDSTYLTSGLAADQTLINASIYGGCENGLVLRDTKVLIAGGQIGNGCKKNNPSDPTTWTWDGVYAENKWDEVINAIKADNPNVNNINSLVDGFNECDAWPFGNNGQYLTYDIFADPEEYPEYNSQGGSLSASDGNSFFGNVFGGGSGYYPYAPGQWRRTAGRVYGNTNVEITGGHILTSVFGAGEISDVMGTSSVKMTGGTVGVPQTVDEITGHPLNSHVFGGGKGDPRTPFNEWTNAQNTNVEIMGGVVFGSVFGGGEDGHVLGNTEVVLRDSLSGTEILSSPFVGTWGTTTFDGNVFGGGRGLSINSPTVGGVVGNTNLTMEGGLVLGSVYGGGRMAAVGVELSTGNMIDDDANGKTNVTVSGGTVGNAYETDANTQGHMVGGNVYGASRGGLFLLDGQTENPAWASMAKVRNTDLNIAQEKDNIPTLIKGNVYGGGEIAQVTKNTDVDMTGGKVGTIKYDWKNGVAHTQPCDSILHITGGNVYGGGHGDKTKRDAAWVMNNSTVAIGGGQVWFNVYGGGEMASVGQRTITYDTEHPSQITAINPVANTGLASVTVTGGQVGPGPKEDEGYNIPIGLNSYDGYVFGGGQGIGNDPMTADDPNGHYFDLCNVNYTNVTVNIPATVDVNTNRIWGSVFGGSEDGHVLDSTSVTYVSGLLGTFGTTSYDGNIFGGGRNYSGKNYVAGRVQGNTHIEMEGGQIYGNIYGGGRLALTGIDFARTQLDDDHGRTYGRTMVLVKGGTVGNNTKTNTNPADPDELFIETFSDHSMGNVYGGGMGNVKGLTAAGRPAASALLVGMVKNTVVEVSEEDSNNPTHIYGIVFGGGEIANVGKYTWEASGTNIEISEGLAKVKIKGGTIGADRAKMRCDLADPSDPDNFWTKYNDDLGYVYGGGEGIVDDPEAKDANNNDVYPYVSINLDGVTSSQRIIDLMATVNYTEVEVSGGWVKASVFGGAEAGHVMHNTKVTISGGQIGAGDDGNQDLRYTDESVFINPVNTPITNSLHGTTHWPYGNIYDGSTHYDPFDLVLLKQGKTPSDGKSWFGNVFGGGSGWFPYVKKNDNDEYQCYWNPLSGQVWGNTEVFIDGGHILNNVYGANEFTNVIGTASITMTDGTVGVPRTKDDILAQPTICYVFGGGCGDPRPVFDNNTNVASTDVKIQGGIIYGSVFGGAEDGHVLGNAVTTIGQVDDDPTVIGSSGTSGVDGNVFGGGRNYLAKTTTPGRVGGNTTVNIDGGTMLGSIYGGGRLGNVGIDVNGDTITGTDHGYATVNVGVSTQNNKITIGHLAQDEDEYIGGNVYGGGKGLAGPSTSIYPNLGKVKQTLVNIDQQSKQTFVEGSVFGGGEDGHVLIDTYVNVDGGQIGGESWVATGETPVLCEDLFHGNVYGGGRGLDTYVDDHGDNQYSPTAGKVDGNTHVMITGGRVCRNVYGGGNLASVGNADEEPVNGVYQTGWANVTLTENAYVGVAPNSANRNGMVFGAGRGMAGETYKDLSMVKNTKVIITGNSKVTGTVYGSGEDGHTRRRADILIGDATVNGSTVDGSGVVIGTDGVPGLDGNVYGGGRGLDTDALGHYSSTAGLTGISTKVVINDGLVKGSVFGGGRLASVGYEDVLDLSSGSIPDDYGMATVLITGDAQIGTENSQYDNGHVFGSGKGNIGENFVNLAYVHETDVTVNGNAQVYGSVFGGGEDGHVKAYTYTVGENTYTKEGNTHVTIGSPINNVLSTCNIGFQNMPSTDMDTLRGNVYGGGRGLDEELLNGQSNPSPTAGRVEGNTKVDVLGGSVWHDVFGGGSEAVVMGQKVTNIVGGYVGEDVYGGSNFIPVADAVWAHSGLKTVNIRGGQVHRNVYGCSHRSNDGMLDEGDEYAKTWTSFVNISGGTIDGSVYGAGYAGLVNGSVCVNIGKDAILNAPNHEANVNYDMPSTGRWDPDASVNLEVSKLVIGNSVYGGSDYLGAETDENDFNDYDQTGYALVFIDGTDYETTSTDETATNYMNIGGGLFGSGTHTESGALGRHILLKDYGTRNETNGEMTSATRTLTTIQRAGNVIIDHANVKLSGEYDITVSNPTSDDYKYGVMRVADTLAVINASGIVLGSEGHPVYMDSIRTVRSLKLAGISDASIYDHNPYELKKNAWYWLGVKDQTNDPKLYYINGTNLVDTPLDLDEENVLLFNDKSKLWVRYTKTATNYYGELYGFFRMRGNDYDPYDVSESFAYARPKTASFPGVDDENVSDGGFLSYDIEYNYFTDEGAQYTKTKQHPYRHPYLGYRADHPNQDYRLWVDIPKHQNIWYVDGTRGWGHDDKSKKGDQAGLYPDKPKKTIFGPKTYDEQTHTGDYGGIVTENFGLNTADRYLNFRYSEDIIYVVGALTESDDVVLCDSINVQGHHRPDYPLKLFRYPGGHVMSNGLVDEGAGGSTTDSNATWDIAATSTTGPGANYGAMLNVGANNITLQGVVMDGLYDYDPETEADLYQIPESFDATQVVEPLVITQTGSTLSVGDSTVLMRGYNGTNAAAWYTDAFAQNVGVQGGALYVDEDATVNVSGKVYITGNKQYLKIGDADPKIINSNVYLPTFSTHLNITDDLFAGDATYPRTEIGITSPIGNDNDSYHYNTMSPVAVANKNVEGLSEAELISLNAGIATNAWTHDNFTDDQEWFFGKSNHNTYYSSGEEYLNRRSVYFGWTWANVVRKAPSGFALNGLDSPEELAWLISLNTGMNDVTSTTDFSSTNLVQTGDIDLGKYVWVPLGISADTRPFAGNYDGQGHLITNMFVDFIGNGDTRYERENYGLFGYVTGDVDRTFVVSGGVDPEISVTIEDSDELNLGGLIGYLANGSLTNSEAAVSMNCLDKSDSELSGGSTVADNMSAGGLVGKMLSGTVHSSMAMPQIAILAQEGEHPSVPVGGLVGSAEAGTIYNSFVNGKFTYFGSPVAGGLLGYNSGATMKNCYVNWDENFNAENFMSIVGQTSGGTIDYCYVKQDEDASLIGGGTNCTTYTATDIADLYGYMYKDNVVTIEDATMPLFKKLNEWVGSSTTYAKWARPGLNDINGDYPVLLLCDLSVTDVDAEKEFRSLSTYNKGAALQYGGKVRDNTQLSTMLGREEYVFVYGDVSESVDPTTPLDVKATKVSIYEHASILHPYLLTQKKTSSKDDTYEDYEDTYVGITFDNSSDGQATSTPTINYGIMGYGGYLLPRDWHMFSTPLSNAPLGFDYGTDNDPTTVNGHVNNPWVSMSTEFSWLAGTPGNTECSGSRRYWMKTFSKLDQTTDGYFPTTRGYALTGNVSDWFVEDSDECPSSGTSFANRYPYGMDFYTWNEPEYHWINFKRNGPNHWHSDEPHDNLEYVPVVGATANHNEDNLIVGRGYMASIHTETFLQSHGALNADKQSIVLTNTTDSKLPGWNLVGNPYHGYLDFDQMVKTSTDDGNNNYNILAKKDNNPFYVVYDADAYNTGGNGGSKEDRSGTAFRYYVATCSRGGEYAGRFLHPHQGFYVRTEEENGGTLKFNEDMVVTRQQVEQAGDDGHFRDEHIDYPLVNLYLSSDQGCADVTVIELERPEWGGARKLKELRVGDGLFYAHHEGTYYAALFAEHGVDRVPLWFEAKEDDIFTINWNTANGEFNSMYLIDNIAGVQYDMLRNDSYTFEGHKGDYPSRFLIVFNVTGVDEFDDEGENPFVIHNGSEWIVTGDGLLQFIDVNGQVLWQDRVSGQRRVSLPLVADGPYLFRLTNSKETKVQKVIITKY